MSRRRHARALSIASVLTALVIVVASGAGGCGSDSGDGEGGSSSGASSSSSSGAASSSSGGASSSSGSSGASSGAIPDGSIPDVQFAYDAPMRPDSDACAQTTAIATLKPLDMYVLFDRSGSMAAPENENSPKGDCNVGETKATRWCRAINALSSYFKSTAASGNAAALQFFADANLTVPPLNSQCNAALYSDSYFPGGPTGYQLLPSAAFDAALNALKPDGYTPTEGAVRGIATFTARPANQRAGRKTIGVLITDGDPSNIQGYCDGNVANLRDVLQAHYNATGIQTFVIGMTGITSWTNMETLASGGNAPLHPNNVGTLTNTCGNGAATCRHWNVGEGTGNVLATAMQQIQGLAIACQYNMPKPAVGVVNPNDVNVEYLLNGVPPAKKLTRVTDLASCVADGWYYDDNTTPTTITLCPQQCTAVQADEGAKINVALGCLGG